MSTLAWFALLLGVVIGFAAGWWVGRSRKRTVI